MKAKREVLSYRCVVAGCLLALSACSSMPPENEAARPGPTEAISVEGPRWSEVYNNLRENYSAEHRQAGDDDRPVFRKYLPLIGPVALLDFLEQEYPVCHGRAHSLGKELYAQSRDLMLACKFAAPAVRAPACMG